MGEPWNDIITVCGFLVAAFVAFYNWKKSVSNEDRRSSSEMATLIVKLENITNGIADIRADIRLMDAENKKMGERIVALEENQKNISTRLDKLDAHFEKKENQ